ncbi:MAG: hypothetical protein LBD68_00630 [Zoogloeaceae bacterium]|nr:hypothetical protein [Zoogloeaceae bacterium]
MNKIIMSSNKQYAAKWSQQNRQQMVIQPQFDDAQELSADLSTSGGNGFDFLRLPTFKESTMRSFLSVFAMSIAALFYFSPAYSTESAEITITAQNVEQHVLTAAKKYAEAISCDPYDFHIFMISPAEEVYGVKYGSGAYGVVWGDMGPACYGGNGNGGYYFAVVELRPHGSPAVDPRNASPQVDIGLVDFEKVVSANDDTIVLHGMEVGEHRNDWMPVAVTLKKNESTQWQWKIVKTEKRGP